MAEKKYDRLPQLQPPATPTYVLRGHGSPIHALHFFAQNARLASGDADGWVVVWDTVTKRPVAVWKAHDTAILEVKGFSSISADGHSVDVDGFEIFTHGRDHKLRVWKINKREEQQKDLLTNILPVIQAEKESRASGIKGTAWTPWLLHSLSVNALNFCAFSLCFFPQLSTIATTNRGNGSNDIANGDGGNRNVVRGESARNNTITPTTTVTSDSNRNSEIIISRPQALIAVPNALDSGGVDIFHLPSEKRVSTIPGDRDDYNVSSTTSGSKTGMVMAVNIFISRQEILYILSGYEDGHVKVHAREVSASFSPQDLPCPSFPSSWKWNLLYSTRPHSQPVLSLHVAPSCDYFLTSAADAFIVKHPIPNPQTAGSSEAPLSWSDPEDDISLPPIEVINTKHAGQQGLRVRSDGKIFATAGWDARIRVYSCKTTTELAVLKWHKEGCYAVAFAEVDLQPISKPRGFDTEPYRIYNEGSTDDDSLALSSAKVAVSLRSVRHQRNQKAQLTHWLAAGSKDGKITLWDIY